MFASFDEQQSGSFLFSIKVFIFRITLNRAGLLGPQRAFPFLHMGSTYKACQWTVVTATIHQLQQLLLTNIYPISILSCWACGCCGGIQTPAVLLHSWVFLTTSWLTREQASKWDTDDLGVQSLWNGSFQVSEEVDVCRRQDSSSGE